MDGAERLRMLGWMMVVAFVCVIFVVVGRKRVQHTHTHSRTKKKHTLCGCDGGGREKRRERGEEERGRDRAGKKEQESRREPGEGGAGGRNRGGENIAQCASSPTLRWRVPPLDLAGRAASCRRGPAGLSCCSSFSSSSPESSGLAVGGSSREENLCANSSLLSPSTSRPARSPRDAPRGIPAVQW